MQNESEPRYRIGSLDNALRLLLLLRESRPVRLGEVAAHLGVAKSTAHRLLSTLELHGFVTQDPVDKVYAPGPSVVSLGASVAREADLRRTARGPLERLCEEVGESTAIGVLRGRDVLYLDAVESKRSVRVGSGAGQLLPSHVASAGKAILAAMSPRALARALPEDPLGRSTSRSIVSRSDLLRELERVRRRGYATSFGEGEVEVSAMSAAVRDRLGRPRAAVTIRTPFRRLDRQRATELAPMLLRCAADIEAHLVPALQRSGGPTFADEQVERRTNRC